MKTEKIEKKIVAICEKLFLHGQKTPNKSMNLPVDQITIADAVKELNDLVLSSQVERIDVHQFHSGYTKGCKGCEYDLGIAKRTKVAQLAMIKEKIEGMRKGVDYLIEETMNPKNVTANIWKGILRERKGYNKALSDILEALRREE